MLRDDDGTARLSCATGEASAKRACQCPSSSFASKLGASIDRLEVLCAPVTVTGTGMCTSRSHLSFVGASLPVCVARNLRRPRGCAAIVATLAASINA